MGERKRIPLLIGIMAVITVIISGVALGFLYADTPQGLEKAKGVFERFVEGDRIEDVELQMAGGVGRGTTVTVRFPRKRTITN